jgi:Ca2+-binding EF-hand superfamily protein
MNRYNENKFENKYGNPKLTLQPRGEGRLTGRFNKLTSPRAAAPVLARDGLPLLGYPGSFSSAVVDHFRKIVMNRGGSNGIRTLGSIFRRFDANSDHLLSAPEIKDCMQDFGCIMSLQDCEVLLTALDRSKRGVSFNDFLLAMRGKMNDRRVALVKRAFDSLDKNQNGLVELTDIQSCFNASKHPDVLSGIKTPDQVFTEFINQWEDRSTVDSKVSMDEFISYYQDVSASIDEDDYFELMMRNCMLLSPY